jgi:nicotinamidase-related amidase
LTQQTPQAAPLQIDPAATALMLMDFQPGIIGMLEDPAPLLDRVAGIREKARDAGLHVGYVRVAFTEEDRGKVGAGNKGFSAIATMPENPMAADAPHTQIHERLAPALDAGEFVVRKTRVGPFNTTDLGEQLSSRGVDTLVLAGISTSGVVLSTVRHAADHDYRIIVLSDSCADSDPDAHRVLTENIFPRQAHVMTTAEFARLI